MTSARAALSGQPGTPELALSRSAPGCPPAAPTPAPAESPRRTDTPKRVPPQTAASPGSSAQSRGQQHLPGGPAPLSVPPPPRRCPDLSQSPRDSPEAPGFWGGWVESLTGPSLQTRRLRPSRREGAAETANRASTQARGCPGLPFSSRPAVWEERPESRGPWMLCAPPPPENTRKPNRYLHRNVSSISPKPVPPPVWEMPPDRKSVV